MNDLKTPEAMAIGALAPWFGAKRNLAKRIVAELGQHRSYWEPFCGSMAVLLAKPVASLETVNDLHGDLINLARVIQHDALGLELYRRARRLLIHEEMHAEARARLVSEDAPEEADVGRALDFLTVSWMGRNGEAGLSLKERSSKLCVRWTANGGNPAVRWTSVAASIPAWRRRLRRVTILRRDAFEMLEKIADDESTAIYVDPPYLNKSDRYLHDFGCGCHERLAAALARFRRARVVVSYYDDPRLADLYPSWSRAEVVVNKSLAAQSRRGKTGSVKATEVLLINGPSMTQSAGLF